MNAYNVELSERLALYSSYLVPLAIIFLSLVSIFNDTMIQPDMRAFILDLIFLFIGALLLSGTYKANEKFRRNIIADKEFRLLLLEKFEPFLKEISKYQVAVDELSERIDRLSKRVSYIAKERPELPAHRGVPAFAPNMTFLIRSLYMSILTLGAIIFLYIRMSPNSIYIILILIFLWWYLITDEYDLFSDISAYIFIIFPILVIPITSLILLAYLDLHTLHIFLFIILVMYVVGYYTITTYYATGRIPFIEKPLETYRNGGKQRNGGSPPQDEVENIKKLLDKLLGGRRPPYRRNGGDYEHSGSYHRNGGDYPRNGGNRDYEQTGSYHRNGGDYRTGVSPGDYGEGASADKSAIDYEHSGSYHRNGGDYPRNGGNRDYEQTGSYHRNGGDYYRNGGYYPHYYSPRDYYMEFAPPGSIPGMVTITMDRDTFAEVLALYMSMQPGWRRARLFSSEMPSFTKSFIHALYEKLKNFR